MPIYEYLCEECETRFEKIVINKQQEIHPAFRLRNRKRLQQWSFRKIVRLLR